MSKIINADDVEVVYDSKKVIKNGPFKGYSIDLDHDKRIYTVSRDFDDTHIEFSCKPMPGQVAVSQQALSYAYMLATLEEDTKAIYDSAKNNLNFQEEKRDLFYLSPYSLLSDDNYIDKMVELMKENVNNLIDQDRYSSDTVKNLKNAYNEYKNDTFDYHAEIKHKGNIADLFKV